MIDVRKEEQKFPFSEGIMAKSLSGSGLPISEAYQVVRQIRGELRRRGVEVVDSDTLREMASEKMLQGGWEEEERFYRIRRHIKYLDDPIFILIGGTTGVGKSTISAEVGHRLGISRVIGTDTIREIMRSIISHNLIPSLHQSSFTAAEVMPSPVDQDNLVSGFREQVRVVNEGLAAVVRRGAKEGLHMVLNGVHVVPGYLEQILEEKPRHLFRFVLSVPVERQHEMFFYEREQASHRPAERYVSNIGKIRRMQEFILQMADKHGVRVVENVEFEETLKVIHQEVISRFAREISA